MSSELFFALAFLFCFADGDDQGGGSFTGGEDLLGLSKLGVEGADVDHEGALITGSGEDLFRGEHGADVEALFNLGEGEIELGGGISDIVRGI